MKRTLLELKQDLKNWYGGDSDFSDDIHLYFEAANPRDWLDVTDTASDVWETMFDNKVEYDSPLHAVFSGVAAQAADGVWAAVADAFGLDKRYVLFVLAYWYDSNCKRPAPISMEEFMRRYEIEKKEWEELTCK